MIGLALAACLGAGMAQAADLPPEAAPSRVPDQGWFLGAGVSYNAVRFPDQYLYATGVSRVYEDDVLVGDGAATGGVDVSVGSKDVFAPQIQLGYFRHFDASQWLWGAKFTYAYLGASSTRKNLLVPQEGVPGSTTDFDGELLVHGYKTQIDHQLALMPFLGHSFEWGFLYAGAGPTLSRVGTSLNGVVGFADITGEHTDITGAPVSFSSKNWAWGAAATVGATYFIDASWFVDVSYTYTASEKTTNRFLATFDNPTRNYTYAGAGFGYYSSAVDTQAVIISLNRVF